MKLSSGPVVIAPLADLNTDNPYLSLFYDSLKLGGVSVKPGLQFRFSDIWANRKTVDILHFHWLPAKERFWSGLKDVTLLITKILLCKALGMKLLYTGHNLLPHDKKNIKMQYLKRFILVHMVDLILVHFDEAGRLFAKKFHLSHKKITTMFHGLYTGAYAGDMDRSSARRVLSIADEDVVFVFFGFIVPYKNIETLIQAFRSLDRPGTRLLLAGRPLNQDYTEELKTLIGGDPRIQSYFQPIPNENVQWYLRSADCMILPYHHIFTSGTSMLSLTFRRPIIIKKCPFSTEYLNARNSIQTQNSEVADFETAMKEFIDRRHDFEVRDEDIARFEWAHIAKTLISDPKAKKLFNGK